MKLIYGRDGSGKSEYVLNEVAKSINDGNKKIYIITPEQFSFTTEKRLLEKIEKNHRCGATLNVEVISFERMAYRVINELLKLDGIGPKVCDCILLFSDLKRFDVFPIDVWVRRVMNDLYIHNEDEKKVNKKEIKKLADEKFGALEGIAQQYLFYWKREA